MSRTVITYGTFDMFHIGHLRLLQRIQEYGDNVIVAVSTDSFNSIKGKKCIIPFEQRSEIVKNIKGIDLVIPEDSWEQKISDIQKYNVTTFIIGCDWEGKFDHLEEFCDVVYLPRTDGISTTEIKKILSILNPELQKSFNDAFHLLSDIKEKLS